jgi:hypothetical protein
MTEDDKFFAWLDGELDQAEAAAMEAKVAADPKLTQLAEQHRSLGSRLRAAFEPVAEAPVPDRLRAAARPSADIIDFGAAKRRAWKMPSTPQWTALAATLVIGVFVGTLIQQPNSAPVELRGGNVYAAASLDRALDKQLASAPVSDVRIGLTFHDRNGDVCRTFNQSASSGLACRDGGHWRVKGLFSVAQGQGGDYRMAAGMDPALAAMVDSTMSGEPFDAAQEKAERDKGWR